VVEYLCAEAVYSCVKFVSDYKRLDRFNLTVKIELVYGVHCNKQNSSKISPT